MNTIQNLVLNKGFTKLASSFAVDPVGLGGAAITNIATPEGKAMLKRQLDRQIKWETGLGGASLGVLGAALGGFHGGVGGAVAGGTLGGVAGMGLGFGMSTLEKNMMSDIYGLDEPTNPIPARRK